MTNDRDYEIARRRVRARRELYIHASIFLVVNAMLFLLNVFATPGRWWFYWPLFGWGIGLASHVVAYSFASSEGGEAEEAAIRREMERHARA
ncbi:MAG: 2TM domain-containing protein [Gemmatimonadaceae bacterium]|nr:2TM domain-containing protein [Gemmatimonadaceae bacterium]NUQ92880.1 2TM domain-containing protein [Gemmatimonadaceae bacterium]NUR18775.1 2TM domain-containing protein [Gemmatimonadaceae bacterium]NUS95945.1 2TM domain-containing protein [Gemmatimonadaceae bacterium]